MADYSKWDDLAHEVDREEEMAKMRRRQENKDRYYKDQAERQKKWLETHPEEAKQMMQQQAQGHGHNHTHTHDHSHSHDAHSHSHDEAHAHSHGTSSSSSTTPSPSTSAPLYPRRPMCGCGFADPDELRRMAEEKAKEPVISAEEKLAKKWEALEAVRTHGKLLFGDKKYKEALAVYDRGVVICTGMYGEIPSSDEKRLNDSETLLNLNMALCQIKLQNFLEAKSLCQMALQLFPNHPKALLRLAQCEVGMGEYESARKFLTQCRSAIANQPAAQPKEHTVGLMEVEALERECSRRERDELEKEKKFRKQMQEKLKNLQLDADTDSTQQATASTTEQPTANEAS